MVALVALIIFLLGTLVEGLVGKIPSVSSCILDFVNTNSQTQTSVMEVLGDEGPRQPLCRKSGGR
jgi:hypothetical protein